MLEKRAGKGTEAEKEAPLRPLQLKRKRSLRSPEFSSVGSPLADSLLKSTGSPRSVFLARFTVQSNLGMNTLDWRDT